MSYVSYMSSIHLALVKGLYDGDTKSDVLSKVTPMNLEDTLAFVEAREANGTSKCLVEVHHPVKSMPC